MEQEEYKIYRKIEAGRKVRVFKNTYNDVNYYRVQIQQKNYDDTKDIFYVNLQFKKGVELDNETDIIIKTAFENCRKNPKDQYNPIYYLVVTDFEIVERQEKIEEKSFEKFQDNLANADDEFDLEDDDLPF